MARYTQRLDLLAVVLMLALAPAAAVSAQEHQLSLEREREVGSKFKVTIQGNQTQKQVQALNGQQVGDETHQISGALTAEAEVLALHENKQVRSVALKVEKFVGESDGEAVTVNPAKRIIVTAVDGDATYAYEDGSALPESTVEILDILATFMIDEDPTDVSEDKMFKLDEPRAAGSTWSCDNELLAKDMSSGGELEIDPEDIESKFQFLDVAEFAGQPSAVFDVLVTLKGFSIAGAAQQGLDMKKSEGQMRMSGLLPLDNNSGDGAMQMQMNMSVTAELKIDAGTVRLDFEITGEADAEFREIKGAGDAG